MESEICALDSVSTEVSEAAWAMTLAPFELPSAPMPSAAIVIYHASACCRRLAWVQVAAVAAVVCRSRCFHQTAQGELWARASEVDAVILVVVE